jgi:hypothetical protein
MKLKLLLILLLILTLFSGCFCEPQIEYVKVPYEVKVPIKCVVELPDGEINQSLNESEKYIEVLKYISTLHKNVEGCK